MTLTKSLQLTQALVGARGVGLLRNDERALLGNDALELLVAQRCRRLQVGAVAVRQRQRLLQTLDGALLLVQRLLQAGGVGQALSVELLQPLHLSGEALGTAVGLGGTQALAVMLALQLVQHSQHLVRGRHVGGSGREKEIENGIGREQAQKNEPMKRKDRRVAVTKWKENGWKQHAMRDVHVSLRVGKILH